MNSNVYSTNAVGGAATCTGGPADDLLRGCGIRIQISPLRPRNRNLSPPSLKKKAPLVDITKEKGVHFGTPVFFEDGKNGWTSLDQEWWNLRELREDLEGELMLAKAGLPGSEKRGLEDSLGPNAGKEQDKNRLYVRYMVLRYKKMARAAAKSGKSQSAAGESLQRYAAKHTKTHSAKAAELGRRDEVEARKIHGRSTEDMPAPAPVVKKTESATVNRTISC